MRRHTPCSKCGGSALARAARNSRAAVPSMVTVRQSLRALLRRYGLSRFGITPKRDGTGKIIGIDVILSQDVSQAVIDALPKSHQGSAVSYIKTG